MLEAGDLAYGAAALILILFALWLMLLSPRHRASRTLALLLAGMAAAWVQSPISPLLSPEQRLRMFRTMAPLVVAVGLSALYFLCVYPKPRGWFGRSRWSGWAVVLVGVGLWTASYLRPELFVSIRLEGQRLVFEQGPLGLLHGALWTVATGIMLLALAVDAVRTPTGPLRRALLLVLAGFLLSHLLWTMSLVLNDVSGRLSPTAISQTWTHLDHIIQEGSAAFGLLAAAIVVAQGARSRDPVIRREAYAIAAVTLAAIAGAAFATFAFPPPGPRAWVSNAQAVGDAAGGLAITLFAGYALLKHRLFDIDVKLRWTISRGTVAAVFVATFFVASQVAQSFFEESLGWALGGIAAGLTLFAIAPLQRIADRVAMAAVPNHAKPPEERRVELYRLALALALSDRAISREEERHLAKLAEELGITHTEALAARDELERELGLTT